MSMRVLIYMEEGNASGLSAANQIRSIAYELRIPITVQMITDPYQLKTSGIELTPVVVIDGLTMSMGYVPSRAEIQRALRQRQEQLAAGSPPE